MQYDPVPAPWTPIGVRPTKEAVALDVSGRSENNKVALHCKSMGWILVEVK